MWTSNVQLCFLKCLFGVVLWQICCKINLLMSPTLRSIVTLFPDQSHHKWMALCVSLCCFLCIVSPPQKVVFIPKKQFCLQKKIVKCALMFWGKAVHKEIIVSQHIQLKPTGKKMQKNQNLSAKTGQHRNIPHPPKKKKT